MSSKLTKGGLPFVEGGLKVGCLFHARRRRWVDLFSRPIKGGLGFRVIGTNLHERYRTISVARLSDVPLAVGYRTSPGYRTLPVIGRPASVPGYRTKRGPAYYRTMLGRTVSVIGRHRVCNYRTYRDHIRSRFIGRPDLVIGP